MVFFPHRVQIDVLVHLVAETRVLRAHSVPRIASGGRFGGTKQIARNDAAKADKRFDERTSVERK